MLANIFGALDRSLLYTQLLEQSHLQDGTRVGDRTTNLQARLERERPNN